MILRWKNYSSSRQKVKKVRELKFCTKFSLAAEQRQKKTYIKLFMFQLVILSIDIHNQYP